MRQLIVTLAQTLLLTCAAEACPVLFMKRRKEWFGSGLLCNVLTNPLLNVCLWLVQAHCSRSVWWCAVLVGEIAVVFTEALLYRAMVSVSYKRCLAQSLLCNAVSFVVGLCFW